LEEGVHVTELGQHALTVGNLENRTPVLGHHMQRGEVTNEKGYVGLSLGLVRYELMTLRVLRVDPHYTSGFKHSKRNIPTARTDFVGSTTLVSNVLYIHRLFHLTLSAADNCRQSPLLTAVPRKWSDILNLLGDTNVVISETCK
jgi:hypothetical protein